MDKINETQKTITRAVELYNKGTTSEYGKFLAQIAQAEAMIIIAEKLSRISSVLEAHTGYYTESGFEDLGSPKGPGRTTEVTKSSGHDDGLPY